MAASARFLVERDLTTVVLASDSYHVCRVEAIAQDLGLDATVSPSVTRLDRTDELAKIAREAVAVPIGRIIGYDRLRRLENAVNA